MNRSEYVAGLRAAADFFEKNENIPHTHVEGLQVFTVHDKKGMSRVAKAFGDADKTYAGTLFELSKEISPNFRLTFIAQRSEVCERVVVERKVIPAITLPARGEITIPEKVEEVVEWRCGSILASEEVSE